MRSFIVWFGWTLGVISLGFSVTVAIVYMAHWRSRVSRSIVLPIHVCGNAIAYTFLSAFVILTKQWLEAIPDWLIYIGFTGIIIGTTALGAVWIHVFYSGPMYRTERKRGG